ncbi:MAG: 3-hydroxyacyl-CoA dehydrogenase NAD-binding domain-containing protein [Chromatiales bacterium]
MSEAAYRHWRLERDKDDLAWASIDKAEARTNVLSAEVFDELERLLDALERSPPRGLVIRSGKCNGFIAGADISEFTVINTEAEALRLVQRGQAVFDRIEALSVPTVCQIHGFCLGGGLELALACWYRIALDDASTRIGLPEVKLGIHPGYGGTVRLTQLIGAQASMDLMLSGKAVDARKAAKLGIVDLAVPARQLDDATVGLLQERPARKRPGRVAAMLSHPLARPALVKYLTRQVAKKAAPQHYPAPYAIIDLWEKYAGEPRRMMDEEAVSCARLAVTDTARNLVRVFFLQERLKGLGRSEYTGARHVHVIGAGVMGGDIAAWCAMQGMQVTLHDREPRFIAPAMKRAASLYEKRIRDPRRRRRVQDSLCPDHQGMGVFHADVVIEAIVENVEAKRTLYESIEAKMKPDALLATNTSSIPLDQLSQTLQRPERLVGLHFFNPVPVMQLVEVISTPSTAPEPIERALAFTRAIDRLPLPCRSSPGFLVNRILTPYLLEAVYLVSQGMAPEFVDAAAEDFGMPMGPVELADTVGLDICLAVGENLARSFSMAVPDLLREKVAQKALGKKAGRGFYEYRRGRRVAQARRPDTASLEPARERLIYRLLNEATACLREGIVADANLVDAGMIFGAGFAPFRGGPLHYARSLGIDKVTLHLNDLAARHGARFRADAGWTAMTA